ncbi:MFS transporter [Streptomyces sp. H34-S4]|uniref:MFS transporter n=1 Tax=Streptomyces sp. H34-S4 TaxID=2996463 RepID=UPI002271A0EB|nr:MFS transporter [Streptomyces sp. H34-S4]MCY0938923.1 MFS transporter [Streptomyces sp. H34-S4]
MTEQMLTPRTAGQDAERTPARASGKAPWNTLVVVGAAQLMVMLDSTVVNVALPSIGAQLPADQTALQWTVSAYVLMLGSLLLFGGRVSDVFGRRRTFLTGLSVFAVASVLCGIAGNQELLVAGRAVQGAGAALLSAAALSVILAVYQDEEQRKIALTAWSGLGVIGATIGVVLGGLVVTAISWRWAFLINIPVCIAAFTGALRSMPALRTGNGRTLRLPSAIVSTTGLASLSFGLIRLHEGFGDRNAWIGIAAAVVLLAAVTFMEIGRADPLLPLHLLRKPTYWLSSVGLLLAAGVMISSSFLAGMYFQRVHEMSAFVTGLSLLPMGSAALVVALVAPTLAQILGLGGMYVAGAALQLVGTGILATGSDSVALTIVALAVIGAGLPACFVPLFGIGTSHVEVEEAGVGSGLLNTFNESGAALGIAVIGTILATSVDGILDDGGSVAEATTTGVGNGFLALAVCSGLAIVVALVLRSLTRTPLAGSPPA